MSSIKEFRLPDTGEGLTEADIVAWKVAVGDTVTDGQPIVEIETAKALVELPCPFAGVVTGLLVGEGDTVEVGTPIVAVDTAPGDTAVGGASPVPAEEPVPDARTAGGPSDLVPTPPAPGSGGTGHAAGRTAVLVGYGPRTTTAARRPRRSAPTPEPAHAGPVGGRTAAPAPAAPPAPPAARALAKPPVRALAKALGVDLGRLTPSGPGGVVTREDVESAARAVPAHDQGAVQPAVKPATGDARTGGETRIPVKGVRRATAQAMVASAFTAPHVTEWVQVDATRTMKLVERLRSDRDFEGVKVSPLLVVLAGLLHAVRRYPEVNASWDEAAQEIVVHHDVNLGVAAATPRGLVVPNVKAAQTLGLRDLAVAVNTLAATAREGRTAPVDLTGGTITVTNVGVFGVDAGTPILVPGEAAILAVGQVRKLPWVHKGRVKPRWVTTLALSFDHRLVDGDLGSRVLADVAAVVEDPVRALV